MIRIIQGFVGNLPGSYSAACPHCCGDIEYIIAAPLKCPKCQAALPPWDLMVKEANPVKINYHFSN